MTFHNGWLYVCLCVVSSSAGTWIEPQAQPESPALQMHHVTIKRGNVESSFGDDPEQFEQTRVFQAATALDVDLRNPAHPYFAFACRNSRLFYLFYNTLSNVPEGRYLIQRIKRTKINYSDGEPPARSVDYQVEAMKTWNHQMKRPDQHYGFYDLHGFEKRTIIKEFEVGFGTITGRKSSGPWPFDPGVLFQQIQPYSKRPGVYDRVSYEASKTWKLTVSFDRHGNYEVQCDDLGISVVRRLPHPSRDEARNTVAGKPEEIVLVEAKGTLGIILGSTGAEDVIRLMGEPGAKSRRAAAVNLRYSEGITFNLPDGRPVNTIFTEPGFKGRTTKGIRHGDEKAKVRKAYGEPRQETDRTMTYDGVIFWLDRSGQVNKIVITQGP